MQVYPRPHGFVLHSRAVEAIFYHLNDLYGLAKWSDVFTPIGLSEDLIGDAIQACGSLHLKIHEMLQYVNSPFPSSFNLH